MSWGCITRVPGVRVGVETDSQAATGVAVTLFPDGAVGAVSVMGGAPGTFGTDPLGVLQNNQVVHALVLTGGSVFGLATVQGVMRALEEQGIGLTAHLVPIPIVAGAVVFDLAVGSPHVRPTEAMGYTAARGASSDPVACGNVGPGAGATTGKWRCGVPLKGGLGSASLELACGVVVGALVVVNAIGDVLSPDTGQFYATHGGFHHSPVARVEDWSNDRGFMRPRPDPAPHHTTIGVVATNALLDKTQLTRVARQAHHGLVRAIRPIHTSGDGDTLFAVSTGGDQRVDLHAPVTGIYSDVLGTAAADVVTRAVLRAVLAAETIPGFPAAAERYPELVPPFKEPAALSRGYKTSF
jgi:L-aminopeptidase/D-esterase-like protein